MGQQRETYEREIARLRIALAKIADVRKMIDLSDNMNLLAMGCAEVARLALENSDD